MSDELSKSDLKKIAEYLRKVYPGVGDQDNLWDLIKKVEQLVKGKSGTQNQRRKNS